MKAIFLDIETTGLDPSVHRPIDIAIKIIEVETGNALCAYQSTISHPQEVWNRHDPVSIGINGYCWEDVAAGKPLAVVKAEIIALFTGAGIQRGQAVFICQNPAFDRSFFIQIIDVYTQERLLWPYHWLDLASMYWALLVQHHVKNKKSFPKELCLSKNAIAQSYGLPEEKHPHRAMQGVDHLIQCYYAVLAEDAERLL